jgi:hypothetical protein
LNVQAMPSRIERLKPMINLRLVSTSLATLLLIGSIAVTSASAQSVRGEGQLGPVVQAYLGYLRNEQNVVDDRVSRREINGAYYRRNSNRIRALRQVAIRIAEETQNDYLPELEAVAGDELGLLFERPPRFATVKVGDVLQSTFRYLGTVRSGEVFYVFARLDPYEQAELTGQNTHKREDVASPGAEAPAAGGRILTRARRVSNP